MKSLVLMSLALAPTTTQQAREQVPAAMSLPAGSAVPGVCMLSRPAVLTASRIGMAATARLRELAQQVKAEVDADREPLVSGSKAYLAAQAKLSPAERQTREQALQERMRRIRQKTELRNREIEATREKALNRIVAQMQPLVTVAYKEKGCGLLIDRASVLGGNMANDLTPAVIKALDAHVATISFDREALPASAPVQL